MERLSMKQWKNKTREILCYNAAKHQHEFYYEDDDPLYPELSLTRRQLLLNRLMLYIPFFYDDDRD